MKRYLISTIIIFLLTAFLLMGCTDQQQIDLQEEDSFIGTWKLAFNGQNLSYVFYENGTYKRLFGSAESHGTWELSEDKLILSIAGNSEPYNYSFSDDDTALTLTSTSVEFTYTLIKQ